MNDKFRISELIRRQIEICPKKTKSATVLADAIQNIFEIECRVGSHDHFIRFDCPECGVDDLFLCTNPPEGKMPRWRCRVCKLEQEPHVHDSLSGLIRLFRKDMSVEHIISLFEDYFWESPNPTAGKNEFTTKFKYHGRYLDEIGRSKLLYLLKKAKLTEEDKRNIKEYIGHD